MYHDIKSAVMIDNSISASFQCYSGVRQGEDLSPLLFSIFINDVESYLYESCCKGVDLECNEYMETSTFLKLIILLYADDAVLFSEDPVELQKSLDKFQQYCSVWKLHVNLTKTKIMIFGSGPAKRSKNIFKIQDKNIEIVDTYNYLGIKLHRNGRFVNTIKSLSESAMKAMYVLLKKARNINLPFDCL